MKWVYVIPGAGRKDAREVQVAIDYAVTHSIGLIQFPPGDHSIHGQLEQMEEENILVPDKE